MSEETKETSFSNTARAAAEKKLRENHREELEALIDAEYEAAGIERRRRLTDEERAEKEAAEAAEKAERKAKREADKLAREKLKAEEARQKALAKAKELAEKFPGLVVVADTIDTPDMADASA